MYWDSGEESLFSNGQGSEEISCEEFLKYEKRKQESISEERNSEENENEEGEEEEEEEEDDDDFVLFEYICIATLEDNNILLKYSLIHPQDENCVNFLIRKILNSSKRKLTAESKKALKWKNRIIYFILCNEKKLAFFIIGLDKKAYFRNYAYKFLRELEMYTKSELFYNSNISSDNIISLKIASTNFYMKGVLNNLNRLCKTEKIIAVKKKMYKINTVMNSHIDNLYQSKGDITALQQKTANMSKNTVHFLQNSKNLKRTMFIKYWKTYFVIACCFVVGIKLYRSL